MRRSALLWGNENACPAVLAHTRIHTRIRVYVRAYIREFIRVHIPRVRTSLPIRRAYAHHSSARTHRQTHTRRHTHTRAHTHTHTHGHTRARTRAHIHAHTKQTTQRPAPKRAADIGTWMVILDIIATCSILTNCALVGFTSHGIKNVKLVVNFMQ